MVKKTVFVVSLLFVLAVPALAQDEYPRIQQEFGYSNIGFTQPNGDGTFSTSRHSGFAMMTDLNLTKMFGIENYLGYYSLSNSSCGSSSCYAFTEMIGGRANYRMDHLTPFVSAAFGTGYYTAVQNDPFFGPIFGSSSMASARLGAGVDIPINDMLSWRIEVSRTSFHPTDFTTGIASWNSNINFTTGIVLNLLMN